MAVETPHFAHPFRFEAKPNGILVAAVDEQHSEEEVVACVMRIVSYERGYRDELPTFGISDPTFEQAPVDTERLLDEIEEWESRADFGGFVSIDSLDELVETARVVVSAPSGNEDHL
jgi:hypothetical protein